jgi:hypothetical protein
MLRCCIICRAKASPDVQLQYCAVCQSALYCSKDCQGKDWRKHKKICKLLNVGHGDMQVRSIDHTRKSLRLKKAFETQERSLNEGTKRFFILFDESTFERSQAAARNMRKIAERQTRNNQRFMLLYSYSFLFTPTRRSFRGQTVHFSCCFSLSIRTCCLETTTHRCKKGR